MAEPESKDPKEEPSAVEELDQNASSPVTEEDGSSDKNTPEEPKPAANGRPGFVRHIVLGVSVVAALLGLWQDQKARAECNSTAEELMFCLKGIRDIDADEVHALMGVPDISDEGSRYADLYEEYIWQGVFNT